MPLVQSMAPFAAAALAILLVPGPVVPGVIGRSVERGRAAAIVSVLGTGTASLVHAAAVAGIGTLLAASPMTFKAVPYAGAAWLIWLGFLPQFVHPARGPAASQMAWFAATFGALGMVTDTLWAMAPHAAGAIWRGIPDSGAGATTSPAAC